jgi:regulatory protein
MTAISASGGQSTRPDGAPPAAPDAVTSALQFVLRSTKARPQTKAEIRAKLRERDHPDDVIAAAIARALALGAIDDMAFARAWVNDRGLGRGYSARRVRAELQRRLVPEPVIEAALGVLESRDDLAVATELARGRAQRMPAALSPEVVARRLVGFLGRRGYPESLARRVAIEVSGLDRQWD